jgi:hypothetical protein
MVHLSSLFKACENLSLEIAGGGVSIASDTFTVDDEFVYLDNKLKVSLIFIDSALGSFSMEGGALSVSLTEELRVISEEPEETVEAETFEDEEEPSNLFLSSVYDNRCTYAIGYDDGFGHIELVEGGPYTNPNFAQTRLEAAAQTEVLKDTELFIVALKPVKMLTDE